MLWEFLVTIKDRIIVKSYMSLIKELKGWILSNYGTGVQHRNVCAKKKQFRNE